MQPEQIVCAKCDKPVEKLEWWDDLETDARVLRVYCHGETDEMRLSMEFLTHARQCALDAIANSKGVAFQEAQALLPPTFAEEKDHV